MYLEIILPHLFFADLEIPEQKNGSLFVKATNLDELKQQFDEKYPQLVEKIWTDQGEIKKDIMLVVNNNLINKSEYDILKFPDHTTLEIMTQFAGG